MTENGAAALLVVALCVVTFTCLLLDGVILYDLGVRLPPITLDEIRWVAYVSAVPVLGYYVFWTARIFWPQREERDG